MSAILFTAAVLCAMAAPWFSPLPVAGCIGLDAGALLFAAIAAAISEDFR